MYAGRNAIHSLYTSIRFTNSIVCNSLGVIPISTWKWMPYVSYSMLIDALRPCQVISEPVKHPSRFRWVSSFNWKQGFIKEHDVVLVCKQEALSQLSQRHPEALIVVMINDEQAELSDSYPNPIVIAKDDPGAPGLLQRLQNYFLAIQEWQMSMAVQPITPEGITHMLNASGFLLNGSLLLYDHDQSVMCRGRMNTASSLYKEYLSHEQELLSDIAVFHNQSFELRGEGGCLFVEARTLSMGTCALRYLCAVFDDEPTQGQLDFLSMLVDQLSDRLGVRTGKFEPVKYSSYALFDNLIQGRYIGAGQLEDYSDNTHLPLDAEYRPICIKPHFPGAISDMAELTKKLHGINGGMNLVVMYEEEAYVLLYSKDMDNRLSNLAIESQLEGFLDSMTSHIALSQVFEDIQNLRLAYQQIQLVEHYRSRIDFEAHFVVSSGAEPHLCYSFEEALRFAIVNADEMDQELRDFSFSHTILQKILEDDIAHGSNDAQILACYIYHERKATVVAEKLNIHRNTVLYRIEKIKNRFGLDFDEGWTRMRIMLDMAIYYGRFKHDSNILQKLVGCDFSEFIAFR